MKTQYDMEHELLQKLLLSFRFYNEQGKPLASSVCDQNTGRLIRQHQNAKFIFGQNLQKRSNIEKVNINIKFCISKLVYSWVSNRRGIENWKFHSRGGWRKFYLVRWNKIERSWSVLNCKWLAKHIKFISKIRQHIQYKHQWTFD